MPQQWFERGMERQRAAGLQAQSAAYQRWMPELEMIMRRRAAHDLTWDLFNKSLAYEQQLGLETLRQADAMTRARQQAETARAGRAATQQRFAVTEARAGQQFAIQEARQQKEFDVQEQRRAADMKRRQADYELRLRKADTAEGQRGVFEAERKALAALPGYTPDEALRIGAVATPAQLPSVLGGIEDDRQARIREERMAASAQRQAAQGAVTQQRVMAQDTRTAIAKAKADAMRDYKATAQKGGKGAGPAAYWRQYEDYYKAPYMRDPITPEEQRVVTIAQWPLAGISAAEQKVITEAQKWCSTHMIRWQ